MKYYLLMYESHASSEALCNIFRSMYKKTYKEEFHNCAHHKYYLGVHIYRVRFKMYVYIYTYTHTLRMWQMREANFKILSRNTNKMQLCNRIYYSKVYWRLNMFRAAHRSSSGALNYTCSLWFIYFCGDRTLPRLSLCNGRSPHG
jgi:hypothetical protein